MSWPLSWPVHSKGRSFASRCWLADRLGYYIASIHVGRVFVCPSCSSCQVCSRRCSARRLLLPMHAPPCRLICSFNCSRQAETDRLQTNSHSTTALTAGLATIAAKARISGQVCSWVKLLTSFLPPAAYFPAGGGGVIVDGGAISNQEPRCMCLSLFHSLALQCAVREMRVTG